jgi:2,3-dihydroxybiphenyl 1,2-dioxygenase
MMEKVQQLGYVGAGVTELGAWRSYAIEVLGHEIAPDSDDGALYLRMDERHHRLIVEPAEVDDVAFIGWEVADAIQMQAIAAQVESHGVEVRAATAVECDRRRLVDFVKFACPYTGVQMEIGYGPEVQFVPRHLPSRPLTGFKTGSLGLGHVVLYTSDVTKTEAFYRDALGFAASDRAVIPGLGTFASFMHCNPRHHSLAFLQVDAPRRAQHVMFETNDIDDVGSTYDICLQQGITSTSLGRHLNDRMFSFYFRNPSGWHFEYGWGAREIDPATWQLEHYNATRGPGEWGHDGLRTMI